MRYINGKQTPEYKAWLHMKARCYNPSTKEFMQYGGRGIHVCPEWQNSFDAFLIYIGPRPTDDHSIDRIDVNGHYWPGNVRWATNIQQQNNKRNNIKIEYLGKVDTLPNWSRITGIPKQVIYRRFCKLGWSSERTFNEPVLLNTTTVTYRGETKRLCEWAKDIGLNPKTLASRLNEKGWSVDKALTTPHKWIRKQNKETK